MQISHHQEPPQQAGKGVSSGRTAREAPVIASSGVTFQLWRLYQHAWLVCLVFPLIALLQKPVSLGHLALGLLALIGFATGYTWLMWPHPVSQEARARSSFSFLLLGMLGTLALAFSLLYGLAWLWLFIGVSAMAGILLPMRAAFAVIVLLTLFPLVLTLTVYGGITGVDWWWLIAFLLLVRGIGLDMIGVARMGSAIRELHTARRELARLAVIEERERLARDLHDLLGQTLSMITLKSELARCFITEEPERCAQELAEIERVSRQMLREVREAVTGYRQPNLICELEGARQLLEAAGINAQIEPIIDGLPPAFDAALAWTVREGVTNVIHHSRARQCRIHLTQRNGTVGAEVLNDGGERRQEEKTSRRGLGLAGLRERMSPLGGSLSAGPLLLQGKEHFRLSVELPFQSQGEISTSQEE
jgi:two-component system, NarL family, sensor histidine kinase DesK